MVTVVQKIHRTIPLIVKRISVTAFAIGSVIGGYGLVSDDTLFKQIGGYSMIISSGLPPLFGLKDTKTITTEIKKEDEATS